jgi:hypothetical protein
MSKKSETTLALVDAIVSLNWIVREAGFDPGNESEFKACLFEMILKLPEGVSLFDRVIVDAQKGYAFEFDWSLVFVWEYEN